MKPHHNESNTSHWIGAFPWYLLQDATFDTTPLPGNRRQVTHAALGVGFTCVAPFGEGMRSADAAPHVESVRQLNRAIPGSAE